MILTRKKVEHNEYIETNILNKLKTIDKLEVNSLLEDVHNVKTSKKQIQMLISIFSVA